MRREAFFLLKRLKNEVYHASNGRRSKSVGSPQCVGVLVYWYSSTLSTRLVRLHRGRVLYRDLFFLSIPHQLGDTFLILKFASTNFKVLNSFKGAIRQ